MWSHVVIGPSRSGAVISGKLLCRDFSRQLELGDAIAISKAEADRWSRVSCAFALEQWDVSRTKRHDAASKRAIYASARFSNFECGPHPAAHYTKDAAMA